MQLKYQYLLTFLFVMTGMLSLQAQKVNDELKELLEGKETLDEIMEVVDNYYSNGGKDDGPEFESNWTKWKRWEWYMSSHLGPEGTFVDIAPRLWKASKALKRMKEEQGGEERNINSSWSFAGPSSSPLGNNSAEFNGLGRVDRITFHPTLENTIYIGTPGGGLWRTTNDGTSWTNLTDHLPSLGISGIVVSHANANHIYILTGDGDSDGGGFVEQFGYIRRSVGVLKSIDGGNSWSQTGELPNAAANMTGYRLVQDPNNANTLLAATSSGLYRTTNGGNSWTRVRTGLHFDVAYRPNSSTRVYATIPGGYRYSSNGGVDWNTASFDVNISGSGRVEIAVSPSWTSRVYLVAGPAGTGSFRGIWTSTDAGLNFTRQSTTPNILGSADDGSDNGDQSRYDLAIAAASNNTSRVIVGGLTCWRSTNAGSSWINSTSFSESGSFPYIHPDVHDLAYNPLNNHLYAATDGGLYKSTDYGVTWTDLSNNIETTQFYHMRPWNNTSTKMMAGCQDNGVKYRPFSTSAWEHIMQADGFDVHFNPLNGEPLYCTLNTTTIKFSNDGSSSSGINPAGDWYKTLAVHNTRPDTVLCGGANIHRSFNGGSSWTDEGFSGSWSLSSCPSNNSRFYAAGGSSYNNGSSSNSGVYRSDDNGNTWTTIDNNTGFPSSWTKITDISPRKNNSNQVWVTFGGFTDGQKVYRSTNAGSSWSNMTANLPNVPVYCVAVDNDGGAYVGTDIGVFYRGPTMSNWMPWSNRLPNTPVTDIAVQDIYVRCSTFGRGCYFANKVTTGCTPTYTVSGTRKGLQHFEASTSISSTALIDGGSGTFVTYKAGNYIDLTEGFRTDNDSEFRGYIGPCGQGGIPSIWQPGIEEASSAAVRSMDEEVGDNIQHAFPLGSIDHIDLVDGEARVFITTRTAGNVEFHLITEGVGEEIVHTEQLAKGQKVVKIDLAHVAAGFHHLVMYNEGKVAHYQEINK